MACSITIEGVFGLGSTPSVIRVVGTVVDCETDVEGNTVIVGLSCRSPDGPFTERAAEVDGAGSWQALIPVTADDGCRCEAAVFVHARCATDAACTADFALDALPCVDCPSIRFLSPDDDVGPPPIDVSCDPDGTATVTVNFIIDNSTTAFLHVRVQPGLPGGTVVSGGLIGITPGSAAAVTAVLHYPTPSTPAPFIEFLDLSFNPTGCPPVPIPLDPIEPCQPADCPVITAIEVELGECEIDPSDGVSKRRVRFTPSVGGPAPVAHNWNYGDGTSELVPGPPVPIEHLYAAAPPSEPELCVTGPGDCATSCRAVPLSAFAAFQPCACPEIVDVGVAIGDCERDPDDGRMKRRVTFTPTLSGPPPSAHTWTFGDGSSDLAGGAPGVTDHLYESKPVSEPELCISGPDPACEDQCHQVPLTAFDAFDPCGEAPPPPDETPPSICGALPFVIAGLIAFALGSTLVAITLQVCLSVPVPAWLWGIVAGIWIAVAIAVAIAYLLCSFGICPCPSRCDWLAIGWIAALAGAIVALYLSGCCTLMLVIAIGLFLAFVGAAAVWLSECEPDTCLILDYLSIAIVTGAGTVIGYLIAIPLIAACGLGWVAITASTLGGLAVISAAACHASE